MPLSLHERDRRYRAVRSVMEKEGLAALLVVSSAMWTGHVRYFSDYAPPLGYIHLIFPAAGDPTLFVFTKGMAHIASQRWVKDTRQISSPAPAIVNRIKELGCKHKAIGLVGAENISFELFAYLKKELPLASLVNVTRELFELRMIKSEEEQALVRQSARIADQLLGRVEEVAHPGVRECDVYAEMNAFMWKQVVEGAFNIIGSGRFPKSMSGSPSDRMLAPEDSLQLEISPRFQGYYSQLTVVRPLGRPSQKMAELLDVALSAQKAGLNLMKPGARAGDVAKAMKEVVEKSNYAYLWRGGHSMGHDLDEPPAIVPEDETILRPGMTIAVHPSVTDTDGDGVFIGDSYLITTAGFERLNSVTMK